MPESTDPPVPGQRGRSLTGFYIALGAVAALVGLGVWLWTPIKVLYWEREVVKNSPPFREGSNPLTPEACMAAESLARTGPRAYAALDRLLRSRNLTVHCVVHEALEMHHAVWALPLVVRSAQDQDTGIALQAICSAQRLAGEQFLGIVISPKPSPEEEVREGRRKLLAWWEREGRAKYGGGAR